MREITTHRVQGKSLADNVQVLAGADLSAGGAPTRYDINVRRGSAAFRHVLGRDHLPGWQP